MKNTMIIASLFMAAGVILGAFGAHGLKSRLSEYAFTVYQTGIQYHFYHAIGIFIIALIELYGHPNPWILYSRNAFIFGIILFSGSLYLLAVTDIKWLGAIAPVGASLFIVGWLMLAWGMSGGNK